MRPSRRAPDELRAVTLERGIAKHAEGSCLVRFGDTHVLCTASLAEQVPNWLRGGGKGWVTAEYGMLPRATHERMRREATQGHQGGRTLEIQRLIGRVAARRRRPEGARRAADHRRLRRAAGGRRNAHRRHHRRMGGAPRRARVDADALDDRRGRARRPRRRGVLRNRRQAHPVLDLDYAEDSAAGTDANFVMTGSGGIVEIQGTAEGAPFSEEDSPACSALARRGIARLVDLQKLAVL